MNWAIGITTVPERFDSGLLNKTVNSIKVAGFESFRLFVDGTTLSGRYETSFDCPVTVRYPRAGAYVNWYLALAELYFRNPLADRYIIFQDDVLCSKNLRAYLSKIPFPLDGYWNLYSEPVNETHSPTISLSDPTKVIGFFLASGKGKGALGLCFDRTCVCGLLSSRYMTERIQDRTSVYGAKGDFIGYRGEFGMDGGVWAAMKELGNKEYCHWPSLLQHTAVYESSIGNKRREPSRSFRGENFDCLDLLKK